MSRHPEDRRNRETLRRVPGTAHSGGLVAEGPDGHWVRRNKHDGRGSERPCASLEYGVPPFLRYVPAFVPSEEPYL